MIDKIWDKKKLSLPPPKDNIWPHMYISFDQCYQERQAPQEY